MRVRLELVGEKLTAAIDGRAITASHPCIAEEKLTFGLGGDSGGPEGEKAGALEFRNLKITKPSLPAANPPRPGATQLPEAPRIEESAPDKTPG